MSKLASTEHHNMPTGDHSDLQPHDTIIVGGGIAGITCALKLQEAGMPYLMLTETVGGRVSYNKEHAMNFGAVFYMKGYEYASEILIPLKPVLPSYFDLGCHDSLDRVYGVLSLTIIKALPQLIKALLYLRNTFRPHYQAFKKNCEVMEMQEALAKDPFMEDLFSKPATDLIDELGIPKAAKVLVSQFVYACTGTPIKLLNALDYCNCAMGLIDTAMRFTFDAETMLEHLNRGAGRVTFTTVNRIEKSAETWSVSTSDGQSYRARNLVLATPATVSQELLVNIHPIERIRNASELHALKVKGTMKPQFAKHPLHLFDESIPLINIGARDDGMYEVFTCTTLDMDLFFEEYEIVYQKDWPVALFTNPSLLLKQSLGEGLFMCGDHNALGLEPAAISGVFVANQIKGSCE